MTDSLRVLFVAPWFATLATAWAQGLRDRGHETMTVTAPLHFDPPPPLSGDVLLQANWRSRAGSAEFAEARRAVAGFRPDVVVTEVGRDPRFAALVLGLRGVPVVLTTHDAEPHDAAHRPPLLRHAAGALLTRRADVDVVFSDYVARRWRELHPGTRPLHVLPLASELPESQVPALVGPDERRDVLVVGRLNPYKNLDFVLRVWRRHQSSPAYRGDRLVVVGDGDPGCAIPDDVVWLRERFRFAELAPRLARAKASLALYERGSQSGVQVVSMQCGAPAVVTDVGGLSEYVPPGEPCVAPGDVAAAAAALDTLADPVRAFDHGAVQRDWYLERLSPGAVAAAWEPVLVQAAHGRGGGLG